MQVVVETLGALERKMSVSVPADRVAQEMDSRLQQLVRTAKINGFRPGKVPLQVVKQRFGQNVQYEAVDKVLRRSLQEALRQENLQPAGTPELHFDDYQANQPLQYSVTFEVYPSIELKPFSDLVIEKVTAEVTEEDIAKTLEGMRKQQTQWEEVDRPATEGDRVFLAFTGTIDDQPFDGGKADNMPLILGSNSTIPGFEEGILNARAGQQVIVNLTFPENYRAENLAGKPVQFTITVNKVEAPQLPELDEAFAEKFGITEGSIEKLREEVKQTLQQQLTQNLRQKVKAEVMAKLTDAYRQLTVPKALVQKEAEHLQAQMQQQFAQYKAAKAPDMPIDMFLERAKERVIVGLVVNEIISHEQMKPDPAKVRELIEEVAQRFDHPEQVVSWYYQNKDRLAEIEALALEDQIVDVVIAGATVVEKSASAAEILNVGSTR